MKYCTSCGRKIDENSNFCTNCGNRLKKPQNPEKSDINIQKVLLILGVCLVLFSTFILGIISWKNMESVLRLSFFAFECILFFLMAFVIKKITESSFYRVFFVIGLILIPYTLALVAYYDFLPSFFVNEAGMYVYLSIIFMISSIIYLLVNTKFKSTFVDYLTILLLFITCFCVVAAFDGTGEVVTLVITSFMLILYILSKVKLFNESFSKVLSVSSKIISFLLIPFLIACSVNMNSIYTIVITSIILVLYLAYIYFVIFKENNIGLEVTYPMVISIITVTFVTELLKDYNDVYLYGITIISLLVYFISSALSKKAFNISTLVLTTFTLFIVIMISLGINNYLVLLVTSILSLLFCIFNSLVPKYKAFNYIIPINIFVIVLAVCKLLFDFKILYILLICSLVYILIYAVLKIFKLKYTNTYLITSLILAVYSMYNLFTLEFSIFNLGILIVLFLIYALSYVFNENFALKLISYIFFNMAAIMFYMNIGNTLYYSFLTIAGSTLIFGLIISKFGKEEIKGFILYSEILVFLATLFNSLNYSIYILFINVFIYVLSYISLIKFFNKKWWRIANTVIGLLTLIRMVGVVIDVPVIASIISISLVLIIITIMYLLDIEKNIDLALISLIVLVPYHTLVKSLEFELIQLYFLPLIIYDIVFTEIINFKQKESQKLWTIIPLAVISYYMLIIGHEIGSIAFNVVLSLLYIFLGLYRKYNYLIIFGVVFMICSIIFSLFTVLNSTAVVILLIIVGFILIGIALFNELKKKK